MIRQLKSFWRQVNASATDPERLAVSHLAVWRVFRRYFLGPHLGSILVVVILGGVAGGLSRFFYAWTARFVADDVVQVHLLAKDSTEAAKLDPTNPAENRLFAFDRPRDRTSWSHRLEASPGRSLSEKFVLISVLGVLLVVILLFDHFGRWLVSERMIHVGQKVQFHMRHRLYQKLHALPMSYHDQNPHGSLLTHLFSDVRRTEMLTLRLVHTVPVNLLIMAVGLVIMLSIDLPLTGLVLLALPTYLVCYKWFHRRLRTVHRNLREREGRLNAHATNRIANFYLVKSFVMESFEALTFLRKGRVIVRDTLIASVLGSLFTVVCGVISGVCMVAVLWIGALKMQAGAMTLGTLLLFYASAGYMFAPVASLTHVAGMYHRLCAVCRKVLRVLDEPITLSDPSNPLPVPSAAPEIRFENVSLRYNQDRAAALGGMSFTLPAGNTLCVMGPSGCGKTTLAKLACRIYDPTDGTVRFDGTDIRRFKIVDFRKLCGFVTQEPVIFDGTIADNIQYGSQQTDTMGIVAAAQYAQIHEFIVRLPSQYNTLTRERGLTLSGGQKQRVNLARTLLYDPKVLVLDDCTAALDAETEARLIRGFDTVLSGRTVILVSHRLSIAVRCDFVLMLDAGRVAEFGPPGELLRRDGRFAQLQKVQSDENRVLTLQTG